MARTNSEFASLPFEDWKKIARMHVEARITRFVAFHQCLFGSICAGETTPAPINVTYHSRTYLTLCWPLESADCRSKQPTRAVRMNGAVFEHATLPADLVLIPAGVIESCSLYIEHPELVAQRLRRFVDVVGFSNVIAGTDCGVRHVCRLVHNSSWHRVGEAAERCRRCGEGAAMVTNR